VKFLIFVLTFVSIKSWACTQKVDESKVMLFVDTNFSDLEIETAKRAACLRGEKLVVVPKTYKQYTAQIRQIETKLNAVKRCRQNCDAVSKEYADAQMELLKKREEEGSLKELIKKELEDTRKSNAKVTNFLLSGHDGGGNFGGYKGSVSREDISDIMNEFADINDVSTLMLLGCYTGVQKEIVNWKGIFPKVRMIGGYDGSAPLSDKPMGHHYLEDLLTKEKSLLQQADEKQLNQYVKANIRGLHSMHSAVYLEPSCSEEEESNAMYYGSLTNKKFSSFDLNQCMSKAKVINSVKTQYMKFDSGEVEPPKSPSDPAIKTVYDQARSLEHCFEQLDVPVNVNSLFNLRFYEAVKENFATFYKSELEIAESALKDIQVEQLIAELDDELAKVEQHEKKVDEENEVIRKDPESYFINLESKIKLAEWELDQMLDDSKKFEQLNKIQNPSYPANFEEEMLYDRYVQLKEEISEHRSKINYKNNPDLLIAVNRLKAQQRRNDLLSNKENIKLLKDKQIWLPNSDNLKKYSRKELRDNIHKMSGILSSKSLPRKTRLALRWAVDAQQEHLIHFQNPFEWHEVTVTVTPPERKITMGETISRPMSGLTLFGRDMGTLSSPLGGFMGGMGGGL